MKTHKQIKYKCNKQIKLRKQNCCLDYRNNIQGIYYGINVILADTNWSAIPDSAPHSPWTSLSRKCLVQFRRPIQRWRHGHEAMAAG